MQSDREIYNKLKLEKQTEAARAKRRAELKAKMDQKISGKSFARKSKHSQKQILTKAGVSAEDFDKASAMIRAMKQ